MMATNRRLRPQVRLGIEDETVFAGDHIAYFYETDDEFERAFGFVDVGLQSNDHCVIFGIAEDTDRALRVVRKRGWDTTALLASGRLSVVRPAATWRGTKWSAMSGRPSRPSAPSALQPAATDA